MQEIDLFKPFQFHNNLFESMFHKPDEIPNTTILTSDVNTIIEIEVPGTKPEDVEITVTGSILKAIWKKKTSRGEEKSYRTFNLSKEVDQDAISASVENGILTLSIPRQPKPEPKRIKVLAKQAEHKSIEESVSK